MARPLQLPSLGVLPDPPDPSLGLIGSAGSVTKLREEGFDHLPALVQDLCRREGERIASPEDEVQGPHEGEDRRQVEQEVVVQQQDLQWSIVSHDLMFNFFKFET